MSFQTEKILPAVLMSLTTVTALSTSAHATIETSARTNQGIVPAVLSNKLVADEKIPERLLAYENSLVLKYAMLPNSNLRPEGRCGTISGSGQGWDDSRFDC